MPQILTLPLDHVSPAAEGQVRQHFDAARLQSLAEMIYEFVASTLTGVMGKEGMKFFPFVFSLFMFVLASNMLGMIPGSFTVTSQIIVTAAFAVLVIPLAIVFAIVT